MKTNNKTPEQAYYENPNAISWSEKVKEIEKEIKYYEDFSKKKDIHAFPTYLQKLIELKKEHKLLRQFQKEIKAIQGELKEEIEEVSCEDGYYNTCNFMTFEEIIDKIFKNKFGEIK